MRKTIATLFFLATVLNGFAFSIESTRFHCADDTTKINRLLNEATNNSRLKSPNDYMSFFADKLLGTPYVAHTLEGETEMLTINVDQLDCTTFVETLIALTKASLTNTPTWYSYAAQLENIRYRAGQLNGYPSRLHYISAWIVDNTARGNFIEITSCMPHSETIVKTLNFMSVNRDKYPALADSANFAGIRNLESGYNMHMFPYINKKNLNKKDLIGELQNGDIICLTTKIDGLDVVHLGIVRFVDGKPHLLHASSSKKEVIIDDDNLFEMMRRQRNNTGIRIVRVSESY